MPSLIRRLAHLLRQRRHAADLRDEMETHRALRQAQLERDGMSASEAFHASRRALGSVTLAAEDTRGVWLPARLESVWQDVRFAVRTARANAGFTTVVVLTLALGIGVTVTMFSVVNTVLLRALPYPEADRLVVIDRGIGGLTGGGLAPGEILALREGSRTMTLASTGNGVDAFLTVGDDMERVTAASATDDMFALLGASPMPLGRSIDASLDIRDERAVSVAISDRLWRRAFGADPGVIGRAIDINNSDRMIVGVLPPNVRTWLPAAMNVAEDVDVWFPRSLPGDGGGVVVARLRANATLEQARTELDQFAKRLMTDNPAAYADGFGDGVLRFRVQGLHEVVTAPVARGLWAIGAAVAFVFLIGCVNVANLMVARSQARQREMAIRSTLGAGGRRILQQLTIEHLVLAAAGAALGLVLARGGVELVAWLRPGHLPRQSQIGIDATSALVAVSLGILATLLCGLVPVIDLLGRGKRLIISTRSSLSAAGGRRLQRSLVIAEVALSIVPLVAAGLMLRSFVNLTTVPLGFNPENVVTAKVPFSLREFPDPRGRSRLHQAIVADVATLPGVQAVSGVTTLPFEPNFGAWRFGLVDGPASNDRGVRQQAILPGYLRVMGIDLIEGRDMNADDLNGARDVAIVDERFATEFLNGRAVGQRIRKGSGPQARVLEVIGVVRSTRVEDARDRSFPHVFVPYHIWPIDLRLVIKTNRTAADLAPLIKRTAESHGTRRAVHDIRPMTALIADSVSDARFMMLILLGFAAISVLLAAVGLYGTLAYLISRRRQEFGVRLAVGATPQQIVALVAREGGRLTIAGVAIGLAGALAATGALRGLLFGVAPVDPITVAGVCGLVALVAAVAVVHPAWRASRVDPNAVLRME